MEDCISRFINDVKDNHLSREAIIEIVIVVSTILMVASLLGVFAISDWVIIGI